MFAAGRSSRVLLNAFNNYLCLCEGIKQHRFFVGLVRDMFFCFGDRLKNE